MLDDNGWFWEGSFSHNLLGLQACSSIEDEVVLFEEPPSKNHHVDLFIFSKSIRCHYSNDAVRGI